MLSTLPNLVSLRAMRPTERAAIQRLGVRMFSDFGDYEASLFAWLRSPSVVTSVASHPEEGLVGFTLLGRTRGTDRCTSAYLLGIAVEPTWRRRGLGRLLLDNMVSEAQRRIQRWAITDLRLEVAAGNRAARQLFESAGFATFKPDRPESNYSSGDRAVTMTKVLN